MEDAQTNYNFSRPLEAPLQPDGTPMKTSVCDEIQQSVERTEKIERQLANAKVVHFIALKSFDRQFSMSQ